MANDWQDYQKEVATFFRSLGLIAETDLTLQGIRTTHDVDGVVRSQHVGFTITWIKLNPLSKRGAAIARDARSAAGGAPTPMPRTIVLGSLGWLVRGFP
jgi:hypothetical protein